MFHESQRFRQHAKHCYLLPSLLRATVWAVSHELICAVSSLHKHALLIFSVSFLTSYLTRTRAANLPHKTSTPATGCTKGYHTSYIIYIYIHVHMISIRIAVRRRRIANKIERRRQCPKRKENENAQQNLHVASLKIKSSKLTCELGLLLFHTTGLLSCYPVLGRLG